MANFLKEQEEQLKRMCQYILESNLLPLHAQEACGEGKNFWCCDWWTIEVLKCLFLGIDTYRKEPCAKRLENNNNFSKEKIINDTQVKFQIYNLLQENKSIAEVLYVGECGHGIEIALAAFIKGWKQVYCYDQNELYTKTINSFFKGKLKIPVEFTQANTINFNFSGITEPSIVILTGSRVKEIDTPIIENPNIKLYIRDGGQLK